MLKRRVTVIGFELNGCVGRTASFFGRVEPLALAPIFDLGSAIPKPEQIRPLFVRR
jgi:hypothetical protein